MLEVQLLSILMFYTLKEMENLLLSFSLMICFHILSQKKAKPSNDIIFRSQQIRNKIFSACYLLES